MSGNELVSDIHEINMPNKNWQTLFVSFLVSTVMKVGNVNSKTNKQYCLNSNCGQFTVPFRQLQMVISNIWRMTSHTDYKNQYCWGAQNLKSTSKISMEVDHRPWRCEQQAPQNSRLNFYQSARRHIPEDSFFINTAVRSSNLSDHTQLLS